MYYGKRYGLTRDELPYILDPKDVYRLDFPGETFRVLKEKEENQYGEYPTRRLVLEGCIANVGIPFRDNDHWQRVMGEYTQGLLTQSFPEHHSNLKVAVLR